MTLSDSERFFLESSTHDDAPLTGNGRWRADDGNTYTAATTLAATLTDKYQVQQWELRHLLRGLLERPDIEQLLRATPFDDKRTWGKAVKDCLVMSKKDEKANAGSAFHAYVQAIFEGRITLSEIPEPYGPAVGAFFKELSARQLKLVACEQKVINTVAGSAGRYDFIVEHATLGWQAIADAKTGTQVTRSQLEISQQCAIYNHADDIGERVRRDLALVFHVSLEHGTCDTLQVDTETGWQYVMLALRTRVARNRQDLMLPYHDTVLVNGFAPLAGEPTTVSPPPNPLEVAREQSAAMVAQIVAETDAQPLPGPIAAGYEAAIDYREPAVPVGSPFSGMRPADELTLNQEFPPLPAAPAEAPTAVMSPAGNIVSLEAPAPDPIITHPVDSAQRALDAEELLRRFKDKASLQNAAKTVGPDIKLTAYRKNIAAAMVEHPNWGAVRSQLLADQPALAPNPLSPQAQQITDSVIKIKEGQVIVPGQPVSTEPQSTPQSGLSMNTMVGAMRPDLVPAPAAEPASPRSIEQTWLAKIANVTQRSDMAQLWQMAHNEGVEWTALMQSKATEKFQTLSS